MIIEGRLTSLIVSVGFAALLYYYIRKAEKGWIPDIRRIPALDAIEEAIGRCAEMGVPAHFTAGSAYLSRDTAPQTFAGLAILSHQASLCAKLGVPLITTLINPEAIPLHEDIIRQAYLVEGVPEDFDREYSVRFISSNQNAYASGLLGIMLRERCGANICVGPVYGSIYTILESGRPVGAITIGGTARMTQIPVVVIMSDYSLIGEEIYATGAYITKDPEQLGIISGKDITKWFCIALLIVGIILSFAAIDVPKILTM
jgi:hypothetical protein